jgi:tripartite-type tricarboxylate transporter receptor subunit TctC
MVSAARCNPNPAPLVCRASNIHMAQGLPRFGGSVIASAHGAIMKRLLGALALLVTTAATAAAQEWPQRPMTLVIPLAAGGGSDGLVRIFTPRLGELLGQSVIVENIGGAGGMIGTARVAKAAPDGYQFVLGTSGTHAVNQSIFEKPLYNAATDFEPVALIFEIPLVLITRKDFPANNLQEFIAYARTHQTTMQYGSSGAGGTGHLACALLNSAIGIEVTHIPYRGGGPAMQDLIAGRIDYQCALANIAIPQVDGQQAKAIAVMTKERTPIMPNVLSAHEQGLKDFEATAWNGVFLPKGTPQPIVKKLHDALVATMETPFVQGRLKELGATVVGPERSSPEYLQKFVEAEIEKWAATIKAANIKAE